MFSEIGPILRPCRCLGFGIELHCCIELREVQGSQATSSQATCFGGHLVARRCTSAAAPPSCEASEPSEPRGFNPRTTKLAVDYQDASPPPFVRESLMFLGDTPPPPLPLISRMGYSYEPSICPPPPPPLSTMNGAL